MTDEKIKQEMEEGKKAENVYSEEGIEKLREDGEITDSEAGFMEGAEGRGRKNSCSECGDQIAEDKANIIEREFNGEIKLFCSEEHAINYAKKHPESESPESTEE